jgi:hypothetical protein
MALWTPAEITTALWLDAADSGTITLVDDKVSHWDDKSGSGRHFSQGIAGSRPQNGSPLNEKNTLQFSSSFLTSISTNATWSFLHDGTQTTRTYAVVKFGTTADPDAVYGLYGNTADVQTNVGAQIFWDDRSSISRNDWFIHLVHRAATGRVVLNSATDYAVPDTWHILQVRSAPSASPAASRSTISRNGANSQANNTETNAPSTTASGRHLQVGAVGNGVFPLTGTIAEIIIASDSDAQKIEGYLAWKWGLEANLPSGHPYENAAPGAAPGVPTSLLNQNLAATSFRAAWTAPA